MSVGEARLMRQSRYRGTFCLVIGTSTAVIFAGTVGCIGSGAKTNTPTTDNGPTRSSSATATTPTHGDKIDLDRYCKQFGEKSYLPSDTPDRRPTSRKVHGPNVAYQWSCGYKGETITVEDMNRACQQQHPEAPRAFPLDPNDAYSWICAPG